MIYILLLLLLPLQAGASDVMSQQQAEKSNLALMQLFDETSIKIDEALLVRLQKAEARADSLEARQSTTATHQRIYIDQFKIFAGKVFRLTQKIDSLEAKLNRAHIVKKAINPQKVTVKHLQTGKDTEITKWDFDYIISFDPEGK